jgi:hypothetical protein
MDRLYRSRDSALTVEETAKLGLDPRDRRLSHGPLALTSRELLTIFSIKKMIPVPLNLLIAPFFIVEEAVLPQ